MSRQRCVVVTGASSGIGQAVSDLLLTQGHEVIGISRQPERSVAHENYAAFPFDLRHISEMPNGEITLQAHPNVDALVSNAGVPTMGGLEQWSGSR